jgi:hypothetical protein
LAGIGPSPYKPTIDLPYVYGACSSVRSASCDRINSPLGTFRSLQRHHQQAALAISLSTGEYKYKKLNAPCTSKNRNARGNHSVFCRILRTLESVRSGITTIQPGQTRQHGVCDRNNLPLTCSSRRACGCVLVAHCSDKATIARPSRQERD